jgi:hypothetical protein
MSSPGDARPGIGGDPSGVGQFAVMLGINLVLSIDVRVSIAVG